MASYMRYSCTRGYGKLGIAFTFIPVYIYRITPDNLFEFYINKLVL